MKDLLDSALIFEEKGDYFHMTISIIYYTDTRVENKSFQVRDVSTYNVIISLTKTVSIQLMVLLEQIYFVLEC